MQAIVSFEAKNDVGANKGDFEMFVDLQESDTILMYPPVGYTMNGIKLYSVSDPEHGHRDTPNQDKANDIASLRSKGDYSDVFPSNDQWSEFSFTMSLATGHTSMTLTNGNPPGNAASYEFLIWLQKEVTNPDGTTTTVNDYADPGIRNRG